MCDVGIPALTFHDTKKLYVVLYNIFYAVLGTSQSNCDRANHTGACVHSE